MGTLDKESLNGTSPEMGTLLGHATAGSYFLMIGLWWTINQFRRFHLACVAKGSPYYNSPTFKVFFLPGCLAEYEFEGLFKMFLAFVYFVGELLLPGHPLPYNSGNGQHLTIAFIFIVNGLTDILMHHKVPFPKSVNYLSLALAMFLQGMLFVFHVYGRDGIDASFHLLAAFCALVNSLAILVEMNFSASITAGLGRSFFTLLLGTWLWQAGLSLYNPYRSDHLWDADNNHHMMLLHLMFSWHMSVVFIIQLIIGGIIACIYRHLAQPKDEYHLLKDPLLQNVKGHDSEITEPTEDLNSD